MYEYKVLPAPSKGRKARGLKGPQARFANAVEQEINALATEGWEYQRTDILPSEERQGLTSTKTVYRSLMVFRRDAHLNSAVTDANVQHDDTHDDAHEADEYPQELDEYETAEDEHIDADQTEDAPASEASSYEEESPRGRG